MEPKKDPKNKKVKTSVYALSKVPKKEPGAILYQPDLMAAAAARSGISKNKMKRAFDSLLREIEDTLAQGGEVRLAGFGRFRMKDVKSRKFFNIRENKFMETIPSRRPSFQISTALKNRFK